MVDMLRDKGTVNAWLKHEHEDWPTNGKGYDFGVVAIVGGAQLVAKKNPDCTLDVSVGGPMGEEFHFTEPLPAGAHKAVMVTVTWGTDEAHLYLNGELAATKTV